LIHPFLNNFTVRQILLDVPGDERYSIKKEKLIEISLIIFIPILMARKDTYPHLIATNLFIKNKDEIKIQ